MPLKVFFSHNNEDAEWVLQIVAYVKSMGIQAYAYENDAQPGHDIAPKIKGAITRSDILIAFLTQNGYTSPYVQQEIAYAEAKGKLIIPLLEKGVPARALGMLPDREYISFDAADPQQAVLNLAAYLSHLATDKARTDLKERSLSTSS